MATLSKRWLGLAATLLGAWFFWSAQQLQPLPGERFGPGLFPSIIGSAMVFCGLLLTVTGTGDTVKRRHGIRAASCLRLVIMFAAIALYVYGAPILGFPLTAFLIVGAFSLSLGVRWSLGLPFAAAAAVVFSLVFETLLRVPLPPGVLGLHL
ncbi:tripartite tricarboxylate transporter TctB family protein [Sinorhizobium arboris]|uniref:tripartite tricarboxylate transporter TctB family protein n=1 Tax=Sinorhizobium arboris TaxID=76745 RepID=UPI0003FDCBEC|nr:tripartite tricarboxylate transporter TctB family protein [Sinorhizobium arboris]